MAAVKNGPAPPAVTAQPFVKSTARKFSRDALKLEVTRALEQAYEKGKKGDKDGISEMLYRAIKGNGS